MLRTLSDKHDWILLVRSYAAEFLKKKIFFSAIKSLAVKLIILN